MRLHGIATNRDFLVSVLESDSFLAGRTRTDFIDVNPELFDKDPTSVPIEHVAGLVAVRALGNTSRSAVPFALPGFRVLAEVWSPETHLEPVRRPGDVVGVRYRFDGKPASPRLRLRVDDVEHSFRIRDVSADSVRVSRDEVETLLRVASYADGSIWVNDSRGQSGWRARHASDVADAGEPSGEAVSALPGTVVAVRAAAGQRVAAGDELVVIEAMKMEHPVLAPRPGYVRLGVRVGQFVQAGVVLADVLDEPLDEDV
jgi:acetyl/propionyl-CoA carboxylase alpha subunit